MFIYIITLVALCILEGALTVIWLRLSWSHILKAYEILWSGIGTEKTQTFIYGISMYTFAYICLVACWHTLLMFNADMQTLYELIIEGWPI